jgi:hypothetical protein
MPSQLGGPRRGVDPAGLVFADPGPAGAAPALMVMVGKANWYLPRWLDRLLPHISIEGAEFFRAPSPREPVESESERNAMAGAAAWRASGGRRGCASPGRIRRRCRGSAPAKFWWSTVMTPRSSGQTIAVH